MEKLLSSLSWLQAVQNNGSLYIHTVFLPSGLPLDPTDPEYDASAVLITTHRKFFAPTAQPDLCT